MPHYLDAFVYAGKCLVCAHAGELSCFCTEVCVVCAQEKCLVFAQRCALCVHSLVCAQRCVHRRSVLFLHRGVCCVRTGEVSCLCTEVCVVCAQENCLVCAQRCELCVHREVRCVCIGELSRLFVHRGVYSKHLLQM